MQIGHCKGWPRKWGRSVRGAEHVFSVAKGRWWVPERRRRGIPALHLTFGVSKGRWWAPGRRRRGIPALHLAFGITKGRWWVPGRRRRGYTRPAPRVRHRQGEVVGTRKVEAGY